MTGDDGWIPTPEWFEERARAAHEHLLSVPPHLLGPAGRLLMGYETASPAQTPADVCEPRRDDSNVVPFPPGGRDGIRPLPANRG